ncbi:LpxI family protein [Roseibium sp. RKSG952]|uniref:LpxI family protein n=1 Tax=Roseibium sp. RKSG952 TaxID=2529384 RepID=UPI0012BCD707|nr:UDP-2,3-diacylglucosamine diphosphatase LpxI [Roseibium sp. RKSG952]MTH97868.1 DUF1009 domain-containing protein [Roseibium sp. RKSG952]
MTPSAEPRTAIIAGNGSLPGQITASLEGRGKRPVVIGIKGEIDPALVPEADTILGWGEIGRLYKFLAKSNCHEIVLIGGVSRRPDYTSILGDPGTLKRLPRIIRALVGGDDSLLTKVIGLFETEGYKVVGVQDVAPELLAKTGIMGRHKPDRQATADMELALKAVGRLGELDIGQAAVAMNGRVVALEGAEGTDLMLQRCADMRRIGRIRHKGRLGVLVKAAKPGQDLRVDLPAIGPRTIELAVEAGLAGIAVAAGKALMSDFEATIRLADENRLFVYGFDAATG